jgi:hypothetical protein
MLTFFSSPPFHTRYLKLPDPDVVPPEILKNSLWFPYFGHVIGALDGTHIKCKPPQHDREASRNRKGFLSQNCLMACSFDFQFVYVLSGWEGAAADAVLYYSARHMDFHILDGRCYLVDAGFPLCDQLLVPYRGVRYHLNEWKRADQR